MILGPAENSQCLEEIGNRTRLPTEDFVYLPAQVSLCHRIHDGIPSALASLEASGQF